MFFLLFIGLSGYEAIQHELFGYEIGVFNGVQHIPLVLLIVLTAAAFVFEYRNYKGNRKWFAYSASIIGLALSLFIFYKLIEQSIVNSYKTIFTVSNVARAKNVMKFEFKEGNKFRLTETELLGHTIYYGSYKQENNQLTILKSNYFNSGKKLPKFGTIRNDTMFWEGFEIMLIEKPKEK